MNPRDADPLYFDDEPRMVVIPYQPRWRVGPLALVLAAISGAIVGAILTAAIVRAAPRSAQIVIPAAVPDVSRPILGLTMAPRDGHATPERPGAVPPSAPGPLTGTASWYAASGLIAAAGPALRHGDWRGSRVTVHGNGRSVTVTLSDWCACYGSRLIDLSDDAFARLAPLSRGLLKVTIDGSSAATLPPTDEELP